MAGLSTWACLTRSPGKLLGLVVLAIGSQRGTTCPEPPALGNRHLRGGNWDLVCNAKFCSLRDRFVAARIVSSRRETESEPWTNSFRKKWQKLGFASERRSRESSTKRRSVLLTRAASGPSSFGIQTAEKKLLLRTRVPHCQ